MVSLRPVSHGSGHRPTAVDDQPSPGGGSLAAVVTQCCPAEHGRLSAVAISTAPGCLSAVSAVLARPVVVDDAAAVVRV